MNKRKRNSKIMLGMLIAVVALGIGYAAIAGINLLINGTSSVKANGDFSVRFVRPESNDTAIEDAEENAIKISGKNADSTDMDVSEMSASITDDTHAEFAAGELDEVGEYVEFTYTVVNESDGIDAELDFEVTDNNDYFELTKTVSKDKISEGETATVKVKVELTATPKVDDYDATFSVTLNATPLEKASSESNSGSGSSEPVVYSLGDLVQYDPVANGACTSGDTCYKWRVITVNDDTENQNIKLQMDHNLINQGAFSTTQQSESFANYGPDVLLTNLATATAAWDESLLLNFQYDTSASNASYGTLNCVDGSCSITNNNTPIATNVKARVITGEELRDIAMASGAPEGSVADNWTLATKQSQGKYSLTSINYPIGTYTSSAGNGSKELSWLLENTTSYDSSGATDNTYGENNNGYTTLSPVLNSQNLVPSTWVMYKYGSLSTVYVDSDNSVGTRPVITIDKSILN